MMNRIIDISQDPAWLKFHLDNLVIERNNFSEKIPMKDLAAVIVSHPQVMISHAALSSLCCFNVVFIVCDNRHLPCGMVLPLQTHFAQTRMFENQASLPLPKKKQVWKKLIKAKIMAQAKVLEKIHNEDFGLKKMSSQVKSGDVSNIEGQAAKRYWPILFGKNFRRDFAALDENCVLNYGYALLRGIVARGICAAGLHPSMGVHHHHRSNPYVLADDFIEPLRPLVDLAVWEWRQSNDLSSGLSRDCKAYLISRFTKKYTIKGQYCLLFEGVNRMSSSYAKICKGEDVPIQIPEVPDISI